MKEKWVVVDEKIEVGDFVFYFDFEGKTEEYPYEVLSINPSTGYIRTVANVSWINFETPPGRLKKVVKQSIT